MGSKAIMFQGPLESALSPRVFRWKLHFFPFIVHLPTYSLVWLVWLHFMENEVLCPYIVINKIYKFSGNQRQRSRCAGHFQIAVISA